MPYILNVVIAGIVSQKYAQIFQICFVPIKEDGAPVLLPVSDAKLLFAQCIDKTECLLILSNLLFQEIYKDYISCFYKDKIQCPLLAICQNQSKPEIW